VFHTCHRIVNVFKRNGRCLLQNLRSTAHRKPYEIFFVVSCNSVIKSEIRDLLRMSPVPKLWGWQGNSASS
jgi:hypothetical protein